MRLRTVLPRKPPLVKRPSEARQAGRDSSGGCRQRPTGCRAENLKLEQGDRSAGYGVFEASAALPGGVSGAGGVSVDGGVSGAGGVSVDGGVSGACGAGVGGVSVAGGAGGVSGLGV